MAPLGGRNDILFLGNSPLQREHTEANSSITDRWGNCTLDHTAQYWRQYCWLYTRYHTAIQRAAVTSKLHGFNCESIRWVTAAVIRDSCTVGPGDTDPPPPPLPFLLLFVTWERTSDISRVEDDESWESKWVAGRTHSSDERIS